VLRRPPSGRGSGAGFGAADREHWKPGSRLARLSDSHSYGLVLILILATFVFMVAAPAGTWARDVLVLIECVTLTMALRASGIGWARPALGLIVLAASLAILQLIVSGSTVVGLVALLEVVLVGATIAVIALGVLDQREVNRQSISGAVCVYLLIGILYTFAYGAVAAFGAGYFFAQGTDGTTAIRVYFSYVTLATLGYGDYTAAGTLGRSISVSEALLGQLYLVTVVALLVGSFGQTRREHRRDPEA
jgi:Ion channel